MKRGGKRALWTHEDERDLQECFESGWTDGEIAETIGRTESAVRSHRLIMGLLREAQGPRRAREASRAPRANRKWSEVEDAQVRLMTCAGLTCDEIAAAIGRSSCSVEARRRQLGVKGFPGPRSAVVQSAGEEGGD